MGDDLRTRIARNLGSNYGLSEDGYSQDDLLRMADGLIRDLEVVIPDREFTDPWGHQWEWCGGVTGTWAWRITRMDRR